MSQENNQEAFDQSAQLLQGLYNEVFFTKLAERGHAPQTEEDAVGMLQAGYQLEMAEKAAAAQQQQSFKGYYASGAEKLAHVLGTQPQQPAFSKQAAARLSQDPVYVQSALTALAAQMAQLNKED